MRFRIQYVTRYTYSEPAVLSYTVFNVRLRQTPFQRPLEQFSECHPLPDHRFEYQDFFGNVWRTCSIEAPHRNLTLRSEFTVDIRGSRRGLDVEPGPYRYFSPFVPRLPEVTAYAERILPSPITPDVLERFVRVLYEDFRYDPTATSVSTPLSEFFLTRRGVCQDYAHLALSCLRSRGIPALYVSGFLNTLPPPGREKILGADATHAWVAAYLPELGWIELDPTNGILVGEHHIILALGRDYGDVSPVRGMVLGGGRQTLAVEVSVLTENETLASDSQAL